MSVSFDVSQVEALADDLGAAPVKVEKVSSAKMTEIAAQLRDDAKAAAPVDTGDLRDSIEVQGGRDYRIVRATARHAFFVEFGTSDTPPQPYLWPQVPRAAEAMTEAFAELGDPFD